jgi:hypothetical protein
MAKTGPSLGQPLTSWDRLSPALSRDGVIATDIQVVRRGGKTSRILMRAAAAVLLVAGGMFAGRLTAPGSDARSRVAGLPPADVHFASVEEAQAAAARSQNVYQASLAYLAGQDTAGLAVATPAVIKARLAALEQVSRIAGAALENAPYDPVVNTLYLNAQGQREASMRMLNTASMRLTTY